MSKLKNDKWNKVKFILGTILLIIFIQFIPKCISTIIGLTLVILVIIFIVLFHIIDPILEKYHEKKVFNFIKLYMKNENYKLSSIKKYKEHYGIFFKNQNKTYYAKFRPTTFKNIGEWIEYTPKEIVKLR